MNRQSDNGSSCNTFCTTDTNPANDFLISTGSLYAKSRFGDDDRNTTYQEFKDHTRRDAAEQLLSRPELKINAVAAMLGFDEPSAFHRSFKKWTGNTPGEYRQTLHR